ncbi:MAG: hypothetical protein SFY68_13180 [Candidatus Sumerlaeia bacterium]|nr:hypothetical protein [Candidatus Sumerlaeia bacterium]
MNSFLRPLSTLLPVSVLATALVSPVLALDPLAVGPADSEFVARVSVNQLLQQPLVNQLIDMNDRPSIETGAKFLQHLTDVNVFTDLYEAWLFARIEDERNVVLLVRGKYNQTKLVELLKINPSYKLSTTDTVPVHYWDDPEEGPRWAAFVEDYVVITGAEALMTQVITRRNLTTGGFKETPTAAKLTPELNKLDFWCVIQSDRKNEIEFGAMSAALDLRYALLTAHQTDAGLNLGLTAVPRNPASTAEYRTMVEGSLAFSRLYGKEMEPARLYADRLTIDEYPDHLNLSATFTNAEVLEAIRIGREL